MNVSMAKIFQLFDFNLILQSRIPGLSHFMNLISCLPKDKYQFYIHQIMPHLVIETRIDVLIQYFGV